MKSYYHAHESAYQKIKDKGFFGWGDAKSLAELGDEKTKEYLNQIVSRYFPNPRDMNALDLGCGTGTTAFIFAKLGFQTTGIDISETALQMGRHLARVQNLDIRFIKGDILELDQINEKFDLIYDSHCLHCIVFTEDRMKTFSSIKKSISETGYFILDTMVMPDERVDISKGIDSLRFDEDYILWHKTKDTDGYGVMQINGQNWCAQRRVYPVDKIMCEINEAGFQVISKQVDIQPMNISMLRLVLK